MTAVPRYTNPRMTRAIHGTGRLRSQSIRSSLSGRVSWGQENVAHGGRLGQTAERASRPGGERSGARVPDLIPSAGIWWATEMRARPPEVPVHPAVHPEHEEPQRDLNGS